MRTQSIVARGLRCVLYLRLTHSLSFPSQCAFLPSLPTRRPALTPAQYAAKVSRDLNLDHDVYAEVLPPDESLARRIVEAQQLAFNYIAVVGNREADAGTVALRRRDAAKGEKQAVLSISELGEKLRAEVAEQVGA